MTFSSEGADDAVLDATWSTVTIKEIASLKDFAAEKADDYLTYRYTGEAVITYVDKSTSSPVYYMQDASGAIIAGDDYGTLQTSYKEGDVLSGFVGMITKDFGITKFIPVMPAMGTLVAENKKAEPLTVTLAELSANKNEYTNRLVRVADATFKDIAEGSVFAAGMAQPVITDATGEGKLRIFNGTTLIGKEIPTVPVHITGLFTSANAVLVAPRSAEDIETAAVAEASLTVSPAKLDKASGSVGKSVEVGTVHISAVNMPAPTTLEISGKDHAMFSLSATSVPAGTSETDVVVTYTPTAAGNHSALLMINCEERPDLFTSISLSGSAIDEQSKPSITVEPEAVPDMTAVVGEKAEQTIKITTVSLPDYAYLKMVTPGEFVLSNTMLLKNGVTDVKITFTPKAEGVYENAIQIYGAGIETVTIPVKGIATAGTTVPEKEGDALPLDDTKPLTYMVEGFDNVSHNKPIAIDGWKNLAMTGTRAWWGYSFPDYDASAGEKAAKVTAYDSKAATGTEEPCKMMLVTPALDFKNAESKMFTFRVRGDNMLDDQTDLLQLYYIEKDGDEMLSYPFGDFGIPASKDQNGEWLEFHIDLAAYDDLADVFFIGFGFESTRGRNNVAVYYIDDVTYGRTDIPVMRPSQTSLAFTATVGMDAVSEEIEVTTANLKEGITLSIGGPNKSKFNLTTTSLPAEGGKFKVTFNSEEEGVHEAYVIMSSPGASDVFIPISVNNSLASGITTVTTDNGGVTFYNLQGMRVDNAGNGVVIRVKNGKAVKVIK